MRGFNDWLGNKLANALSTMAFFYVCLLLDLIELPPVIHANSVIIWCTYLSQTVVQLLALPLLAYQNNQQTRRHDELKAKVSMMHKHVREVHTHLGVSNDRKG